MSDPTPKKVLFVCVANSCRSQMAEVVGRHLDKESRFQFDSCGAMPGGWIDPGVIDYARVLGWDMSAHSSKGFEDVAPLETYAAVVALCAEACVNLPRLPQTTKLLQWPFADPTSQVGAARAKAYEDLHHRLAEKIQGLMDYLS